MTREQQCIQKCKDRVITRDGIYDFNNSNCTVATINPDMRVMIIESVPVYSIHYSFKSFSFILLFVQNQMVQNNLCITCWNVQCLFKIQSLHVFSFVIKQDFLTCVRKMHISIKRASVDSHVSRAGCHQTVGGSYKRSTDSDEQKTPFIAVM